MRAQGMHKNCGKRQMTGENLRGRPARNAIMNLTNLEGLMDINNVSSRSLTLSFFGGLVLSLSLLGDTPSFTMLTVSGFMRG